MTEQWKLYDDLIEEIPRGIIVEDFCVGCAWTSVKAAGEWGIALTVRQRAHKEIEKRSVLGLPLCEAAALVKSWNFIEASIGMAAINAWYNSKSRVEKLGLLSGGVTAAEERQSVFEKKAAELRGKKVAVIGHFPKIQNQLGEICRLSILEREPQRGDYPDSACEFILPEQDYVFITGMTFTNKTLPRLLQLSRNCEGVYLVGPSVPLADCLRNYGVTNYSAFCVTDAQAMQEQLRRGAKQEIFKGGRMLEW